MLVNKVLKVKFNTYFEVRVTDREVVVGIDGEVPGGERCTEGYTGREMV